MKSSRVETARQVYYSVLAEQILKSFCEIGLQTKAR